jgi:hypothetical protein
MTQDTTAAREDATRQMRSIGLGPLVFQAVYAASQLGVADALADGPRRADEIATTVGAHAPSLSRLLRALAVAGVFAQDDAGRFSLTPGSELLRSDAPGSLRDWFALQGADWYQRMLAQLEASVRTGTAGATSAFGVPFFAFLDADAEARRVFDRAMTSQHVDTTPAIVASYDFPRSGTVVDVGGGHGGLLRTILRQHPGTRGVLFDLPAVVEGAHRAFRAAGLADRCELIGGSFFEGVPAGGDLYVLMLILHDFDDEAAGAILGQIRRVIPDDGRLLVLEQVLPPGSEPHPGKLRDLAMLLVGGKERTEAEFRAVLAAGGFALERVLPIGSIFNMSILEARPS